jgi:hypothetical protein
VLPTRQRRSGRVPIIKKRKSGIAARVAELLAGFAALLDRIEGNACVPVVKDASRFARELITQELAIMSLITRGVRVLTANGDDLTTAFTASSIKQMLA